MLLRHFSLDSVLIQGSLRSILTFTCADNGLRLRATWRTTRECQLYDNVSADSSVPVIGLFSGAGGLDIGATWAGADVRLSVDNDPVACETLRRNSTSEVRQVLQADVATLSGRDLRRKAGLARTDACIVVGGPPCQPFSKASYWT